MMISPIFYGAVCPRRFYERFKLVAMVGNAAHLSEKGSLLKNVKVKAFKLSLNTLFKNLA